MIIKTDYQLNSALKGCNLLLRNKHTTGDENFTLEHIVLFVHGATYASTHTFDYALDEESWMDWLAARGFDAWCLDLPGYGGSTRPPEMSQPADANEPLVDTDQAVQELAKAVEFICERRSVASVSLIGYSWGTAICGRFAGQYPDKVQRLVMSGALWVPKGAKPSAIDAPPGA